MEVVSMSDLLGWVYFSASVVVVSVVFVVQWLVGLQGMFCQFVVAVMIVVALGICVVFGLLVVVEVCGAWMVFLLAVCRLSGCCCFLLWCQRSVVCHLG